MDNQLGLEPTPELYVAHMVEVFREVRRVLRDDGTLWLNLGDSYNGSGPSGGPGKQYTNRGSQDTTAKNVRGLKPKDLVGIPWRVAFALQADGWYLRCDIIWSKPNPMPESVTDRPTKSHEYIFLLSKSKKYHYDADAIREPHVAIKKNGMRNGGAFGEKSLAASEKVNIELNPDGRNKRSVWTVTTKPTSNWSNDFTSCDYVGQDGRPYKVSQDCPVHGVLHYLLSQQKELYDELLDFLSTHNPHIDNHPVLKQFFLSVSNFSRSNDKISLTNVRRQKIGNRNDNKNAIPLTSFLNQDTSSRNHYHTNRIQNEYVVEDDNSDCSCPYNDFPAKLHNNQTHKKDPFPCSISPYISFDKTLYDKLHIEEELVKIGWAGHNFENNILVVWFLNAFYLSGQTPSRIVDKYTYGTICTCEINSLSHFATFPPDLIKPCILAGCPEGGTVLDPFGGSGTTAMVCRDLGRSAILIDLNPEYREMATKRGKLNVPDIMQYTEE